MLPMNTGLIVDKVEKGFLKRLAVLLPLRSSSSLVPTMGDGTALISKLLVLAG